MSTLGVATIKSRASNTPPTIQDASDVEVGTFCRAWVATGDGGAITGSFNISSVSEPDANTKRINFTTAMPDANYCVVGSAGPGPDNDGPRYPTIRTVTSTYAEATYSDDASNNSVAITYWAIFS